MFALSCLDIINSFFIAFKVALTTKKGIISKRVCKGVVDNRLFTSISFPSSILQWQLQIVNLKNPNPKQVLLVESQCLVGFSMELRVHTAILLAHTFSCILIQNRSGGLLHKQCSDSPKNVS